MRPSPTRGYAALISTLVICTVLTTLAFQASTSAYIARLAVLESEYGEIARANAYSCAQVALFELSADMTYRPMSGGDEVMLPGGTSCVIESVSEEEGSLAVIVRGSHKDFVFALELYLEENPASRPPFAIRSFRKI